MENLMNIMRIIVWGLYYKNSLSYELKKTHFEKKILLTKFPPLSCLKFGEIFFLIFQL